MRVAVTAGGTGGHIYPALSIIEALQAREGDLDIRFFGPDDRGERPRVEAAGISFSCVSAAPVRGRGPISLLRSLGRLAFGTLTAFAKFLRFRPQVVLSTGGYASFPCSLAAWAQRRPLVVYLPDVSPGWAVRAEMRIATRLATTTEAALSKLPARKTTVTGYPVRPEFFETSRSKARQALDVLDETPIVLVAGASQGASAINQAVFGGLQELCKRSVLIHVTGADDLDAANRLRDALPETVRENYRPAAYRDDLPTVMVAADLAVLRAGASTLGEVPAAGLPSVLVPGTFAGGHQRDNAQWLADRRAATILAERNLAELVDVVSTLLSDPEKLSAMRESARQAAKPDAAADVAALVTEVAKR